MSRASDDRIDLDALSLRPGQAARLSVELEPQAPVAAGETLILDPTAVPSRIEVSRTGSGFALRLLSEVGIVGTCARCLGEARLRLDLDEREVDQEGGAGDPDFSSPYVDAGLLDATAWLHDAVRLAIPEQILCRADCAGLCDVCGASLNDFAEGEHEHEAPRDPRFAKLRELEH